MSFNKIIIGALALAIALITGTTAQAVPTLGVAGGTYLGDDAVCSTYIECFSGTYSSTDGWSLGSSPATITVFANEIANMYLVTTAPVTASVGSDTFSSIAYTPVDGHWDGYTAPYWSIALGSSSDWTELNNAAMNPDQFYGETLTLTFSGTLSSDQYFFLVADDNGTGGMQAQGHGSRGNFDSFSPKTTSSHPDEVPEPSMLMLLGSGLLGLGLLGRRKFRK